MPDRKTILLYTYYKTAVDHCNDINNNIDNKAELPCTKEVGGCAYSSLFYIIAC